MAVIKNQLRGASLLHFTANGYANVTGNTTVSDIAVAGSDENVYSCSIRKVWYSSANSGYWTVTRGANVVLQLWGTGYMEFDSSGDAVTKDAAAANVVVTLTGSAIGFIMLDVKKQSNSASYKG